MTSRVLLPLFALFIALLPACGESADAGSRSSEPGVPGAPDPEHAGTAGGNSLVGAGGSAFAVVGGANASPGGSGSLGIAPPATWNSAKSATISASQLKAEYEAWKLSHVEACANGSKVVVRDGEVISSGIAYGLLLSVAMADQPLFDGLWKFYQDHLDKKGLMNWKTAKCEAPGNNNENAATDADLDATMALIQASSRWPNAPAGYLAKAEALAAKIIQFETEMCDGRRILRPGDAFGGCSDAFNPRINPSYFSPAYYKVFAHYFSAQSAVWLALSDASYQLYAIYQARSDNLVPDWSAPDGSLIAGQNQYSYDACRVPWRVAVDYAWTGDKRAKIFMENISSWVDEHGGLPRAAQQQNSAFVGAFALAGGYDQGKFDGYMSGWLGAQLDDTPTYQGTLRVLYLLVAAGKFSSTL
jgi:endoglucanase